MTRGELATVASIDLSSAKWRKSTRSSGTGQCVEVAFTGGIVAVRDSKDPAGPALTFEASQWRAFVCAVPAASR